jgi:hypothetical protein
MTRSPYDNELSPTNVYGRALALLGQYDVAQADAPLLHLDVACGYAAIASEIESTLGRTYVGLDIDEISLQAVRAGGFEAHSIDLQSSSTLAEVVRRIVGDRRVASITFLDGLEHVTNAHEVLTVIRALAAEHSAVVVLSVPNVTHRDVGYKLSLGSWTITESGLLDKTHVGFYGRAHLSRVLGSVGLYRVAENNVETSVSDQHFPETHSALMPGTTINKFMNSLRDAAEPSGRVQQFVWACLAGPSIESESETHPAPSVFLTVVIRTQGRRLQELQEALLCLDGQSVQDFEVVMLAHNTDVATQIAIEQVIEDQGDALRNRIRLELVDHGTRATLLNLGFAGARGRYVAVLDDDDLVFGHWVESFAKLADRQNGSILRSVGSVQDAGRVAVRGRGGIQALGSVRTIFDTEFSYVRHLATNSSPLMTMAFPIGVFRDMGLRFDETLTTTEDWDYILRAAQITGVSDSRQLTAIYHQWPGEESSHTEHDDEVWRLNQLSVDRKIDSQPVLLQQGETRFIRQLVRNSVQPAASPTTDSTEREVREQHLLRLSSLVESNSWRVTHPLRWFSRVFGAGHPVKTSQYVAAPTDNIAHAIRSIEVSRSWRMTRWLRRGPS